MAEQRGVGRTAEILSGLALGERVWFWFSPDLDREAPQLLLTTLQADPGMDRILKAAVRLPLPAGGRQWMGLGHVGADGRIQLGAPGLDRAALEALAGWVQHHAPTWPALARLAGARMLAVAADGEVTGQHHDEALWGGLRPPPAPGSLDAAAIALAGLSAGQDAWAWMARGPAGLHLLVSPLDADPEGRRFQAHLRGLRAVARARQEVAGLLRATSAGPVLTTQDDLDTAATIATSLLAARPEVGLRGLRLLRLEGDQLVGGRALQAGPDLARQRAALAALDSGEVGLFWFTDDAGDGQPMLLLDQDPDALRAAAQALGAPGRSLRGRVRASKSGWLEFRARTSFPRFVPALAAWTAAHLPDHPPLARLIDARLTVRDDQDEVIERQRDDAAWSPLRSPTPHE